MLASVHGGYMEENFIILLQGNLSRGQYLPAFHLMTFQQRLKVGHIDKRKLSSKATVMVEVLENHLSLYSFVSEVSKVLAET